MSAFQSETPDPVAGAETAADIAEAQAADPAADDAIQRLAAERDELRDQLMRALADMQNQRKRLQAQLDDNRRFATESLVRELLPVLDNFERTITAAESGATLESLLEGVRAVDRQLRNVLESVRLTRIPALGAPFDPEHHEAIATETTDEHPEDTVIHEVEPGYKMGERVIRPARVRVSRRP